MTPDNNRDILPVIRKIQSGDKGTREDFLDEYRPFVAKTAMNLCKRPLDWRENDELSIALIAFNSALDSYDFEKKVPFLPYARVVIQNKLKDYFRKQSRLQVELPLETDTVDGKTLSPAEIQSAWADFQERTIEDERQEELEEYENLLSKFSINFETLVEVSPKHRDSRHTLLHVSKMMATEKELMDHVLEKKQLPINDLIFRTGVNRKTLERGRKFIIATALVLYYAADFQYIRSYIDAGDR